MIRTTDDTIRELNDRSAIDRLDLILRVHQEELDHLDMMAIHTPMEFTGKIKSDAEKLIGLLSVECRKFEVSVFPTSEPGEIKRRFDAFREPGHEHEEYPPSFGTPMVDNMCQRVYAISTQVARIADAIRFAAKI